MSSRAPVKIEVSTRPAGRIQVRPVTEAECKEPAGFLPAADRERLQSALRLGGFTGVAGTSHPLSLADGGLLWLVGMGAEASTQNLRRAVARATALLAKDEAWSLFVDPAMVGPAVEGALLSAYRFTRKREPGPTPGPCTLVASDTKRASRDLERARALCEGVLLTRDLVNTPAADLGPRELADAAHEVGRRHGMQVQGWEGAELLEQGFGLVEAVGRASARPPTFTVLRMGPPDVPPKVALVGKGVVFDSGGLDIKSASGMLLMRKDMGGAGTMLGVMDALGRLGVQAPLMAVLPSAENSVGPAAYRPGDILKSHSGRTVEIGNTDAEGRLLLADGISYALGHRPERLLDLATLTGAARVALGPDVPALFGTDEDLVGRLLCAAGDCDEGLWRMPLVEDYDAWLDTPFADVNHMSSDSRAGAITAALFLRRFVGDCPWSHVDLYAWEDKGRPEAPKGGNGSMVRTVTRALEGLVAGS